MKRIHLLSLLSSCLLLNPSALAKSTPEEIAQLGSSLTCAGADKAGNKDGVAAYTGKWLGAPAGINGTTEPTQDPYAGEKSLYTVTPQNMAQYAAFLSPGQQAMFKKYTSYKVPVYPSHRDFRYPDWVCERTKENAKNATLVDDGLGVEGVRGSLAFFPFPKTGLELATNAIFAFRASEAAIYDVATVYPDGKTSWSRQDFKILAHLSDPEAKPTTTVGTLSMQANVALILPLRSAGVAYVAHDYFNIKTHPRLAYGYDPGTRRVRQNPAFGFDSPDSTTGVRTIDEDRLFNGSPERYDWKILGKKSLLIPYNAYALDDSSVSYKSLLTPGHLNPEKARYEMHRVWVLEATVKPNFRHKYAKRVIYIDEDTWQPVMTEIYDARGQLWHFDQVNLKYDYNAQMYVSRISTYNDLLRDLYVADRMFNEIPTKPKYGKAAGLDSSMFTPEYARRMGR